MKLNRDKIKEELDKEKESLLEQLRDIGKLNPQTNEWEAVPEEMSHPESDLNDMADRFEDFESRSSMLKILEKRLKSILNTLKGINHKDFGKCEICKKNIEADRLKANSAARTCKKHLNE